MKALANSASGAEGWSRCSRDGRTGDVDGDDDVGLARQKVERQRVDQPAVDQRAAVDDDRRKMTGSAMLAATARRRSPAVKTAASCS